ncbi:hypothetical protein HHK36_008983 [Tetracentron sinense]|uniref:Uncharacterized protein n=1 Tax=Tetracentron sinense TaxID=13715 RepID=A0A835DH13_TETSI|nr:hypothetical protein HHK36_008983 [Tetracentron sinense]
MLDRNPNENGSFGIGALNCCYSEYTPRLIKKLEGVKVKNVAAGLLHSACLDENGSVFIFGERAVDKIGFGEANNATSPSIISKLPFSDEVACGGYHTCIITSTSLTQFCFLLLFKWVVENYTHGAQMRTAVLELAVQKSFIFQKESKVHFLNFLYVRYLAVGSIQLQFLVRVPF